jgi:hypothetical protein
LDPGDLLSAGARSYRAGNKQEQGPLVHAAPVPSTQMYPVQHAAVGLHACSAVPQPVGGGGPQTPLVQTSPALQHRTVAEQLWLVLAQTDAATQVPEVAPAGMAQEVPAQQSAFTVQVPFTAWQEDGGVPVLPPLPVQSAQVPLVAPAAMVQVPLQQSVPAAQVPPVSLQVLDDVGSRHAKNAPLSPYASQVSPEQQLVSLVPVHCAPNGVQVAVVLLPPPHFSFMPSFGSGAHAWLLQHWSLNWQIWPGSMQHCGLAPS